VERTLALLAESGALPRPLTASDSALLNRSLPASLGEHLAQAPMLEDITLVARQVAVQLTQRGWAEPGGDLLRYRPNLFRQAAINLHAALGGTAPTFFTRLQDEIASRYNRWWREHVAQLNDELFERAAGLYTRLAL